MHQQVSPQYPHFSTQPNITEPGVNYQPPEYQLYPPNPPQYMYPQPNAQYFPVITSNPQFVQQPITPQPLQLTNNFKPIQSTTSNSSYEKGGQQTNFQTNVILPQTPTFESTNFDNPNCGFAVIEQSANEWLVQRLEIIKMLDNLIQSLEKKQQSTAKTKVKGTKTNIVGASLILGGIVAAPFTFGVSLIASGAGIGCVGVGTTATVAASIAEWKHAKKSAKSIQELLQRDTQAVNAMIRKIYEQRLTDPYIDSRVMKIGNRNVNVLQFVESLTGHKHQDLDKSDGLTNGHTGIMSLTGLMIKSAIPIVAIPVDLVLLMDESKKANGKVPSKLTAKLTPILHSIKVQTNKAIGCNLN
ncbi:predicted protein [Naegleria gruberi]|uniref:Predicted protein n=1 Tax=Naegleria gruberi TaxID=5762 RepID=D2W5W4_NAEGR|nr:uncharacterized protein NAEGRDRAFT_54865 [Naegleria gruberi]EFC35539.1 predicted protein [Naegleria gruberi]|eukprot:XP_002668283.1 predicted protein [Naegleria gruberi strain NEG-M]